MHYEEDSENYCHGSLRTCKQIDSVFQKPLAVRIQMEVFKAVFIGLYHAVFF